MFLLLSSQLDEKSSGQNLLIKATSNEIDGVNFGLEDDLEGSRIVLLDLDEVVIRECLFNILLHGIEVAFDQIQRDVLDIVRNVLDFLN
jgi:hypothetical protein